MGSGSKIFVSYSTQDLQYLEGRYGLKEHLDQLDNIGISSERFLSAYDIAVGEEWDPKIQKFVREADYAILCISSGYIASQYIQKKEQPVLVSRAESGQVRLIPLMIRPCAFKHTKLAKYQCINPPNRPLSQELRPFYQETIFNKIIDLIIESEKRN